MVCNANCLKAVGTLQLSDILCMIKHFEGSSSHRFLLTANVLSLKFSSKFYYLKILIKYTVPPHCCYMIWGTWCDRYYCIYNNFNSVLILIFSILNSSMQRPSTCNCNYSLVWRSTTLFAHIYP